MWCMSHKGCSALFCLQHNDTLGPVYPIVPLLTAAVCLLFLGSFRFLFFSLSPLSISLSLYSPPPLFDIFVLYYRLCYSTQVMSTTPTDRFQISQKLQRRLTVRKINRPQLPPTRSSIRTAIRRTPDVSPSYSVDKGS